MFSPISLVMNYYHMTMDEVYDLTLPQLDLYAHYAFRNQDMFARKSAYYFAETFSG